MEIALIGGTGDIGEGLALRFGFDTDHTIVIGSRDEARAESAAESYSHQLRDRGRVPRLTGATNENAVHGADVIVLSIPPYHVGDSLINLESNLTEEQIIVSPAVGMQGDEAGLHYQPPKIDSVTSLVANHTQIMYPTLEHFTTSPLAGWPI